MAVYCVEDVTFKWDLTPKDIAERTDQVIERSRKIFDSVGALKPGEVTLENCLQVLVTIFKEFILDLRY